ncbi:hypothetical protein YC2023_068445 [Brassica napus]
MRGRGQMGPTQCKVCFLFSLLALFSTRPYAPPRESCLVDKVAKDSAVFASQASKDSSSQASAAEILESSLFIRDSDTCLATEIMSRITLGSKPNPPLLVNPQICPVRFTDIDTAELI